MPQATPSAETPVVAPREHPARPLRRFVKAWQGIALSLVGIVATLWLGFNGQLGLYIHPRYFWFTLVMAVLAGVCAITACIWLAGRREPSSAHSSEHSEHSSAGDELGSSETRSAGPSRALAASVVGILTVLAAIVALLVLPPSTLTAATATQRTVNAGVGPASAANAAPLVGGDSSQFSVRDWAILLRQNPDPAYLSSHSAEVSGFVLPSDQDPENVFYVARFIITCCAVDAQPVGVPVYLPGWKTKYDADTWVAVSGTFASNPATGHPEKFALMPADIATIDVPEQPYVY